MVAYRKATPEDISKILSKMKSGSFGLELLQLDPAQARNMDDEDRASFIDSEYGPSLQNAVRDERLLVSEDGGDVNGYSLSYSRGRGRWVITALDVEKGAQGEGIGSVLAEKTMDHLRNRGGKMVEVSPERGVGEFWEKMGFRPVKEGKRLERRL